MKDRSFESRCDQAQRLSATKCFYYDQMQDEVRGPVSMWQVKELIEYGQIRPDTHVILCGSDYWRSYYQDECGLLGVRSWKKDKIIHADREMVFYILDGEAYGPISLGNIYTLVFSGKLPSDVSISFKDAPDWISLGSLLDP